MKKLVWPFLFAIGLAVIFYLLASSITNISIENFDHSVAQFIQSFEMPWLTKTFVIITNIGSSYTVAIYTIIICLFLWSRNRAQAVLLFSTVASTMILNYLLKIYFQRERPSTYLISEASGYSFPSGHTMTAFSFYPILAFILWQYIKKASHRVLLCFFTLFMASAIAISRIYLGVHFPTDILGGIIASAFWLTITLTVYQISEKANNARMNR